MNNDGNKYNGADRRAYPRVNASISYSISEKDIDIGSQQTINISASGISFFAKEELVRGSILSLTLTLPDTSDIQQKLALSGVNELMFPGTGLYVANWELNLSILMKKAAKQYPSMYFFASIKNNCTNFNNNPAFIPHALKTPGLP